MDTDQGYRQRIAAAPSEAAAQGLYDEAMVRCKQASPKTKRAWSRTLDKRLKALQSMSAVPEAK